MDELLDLSWMILLVETVAVYHVSVCYESDPKQCSLLLLFVHSKSKVWQILMFDVLLEEMLQSHRGSVIRGLYETFQIFLLSLSDFQLIYLGLHFKVRPCLTYLDVTP